MLNPQLSIPEHPRLCVGFMLLNRFLCIILWVIVCLFTFYFIVSLGMLLSICLQCRLSGYACGIPKLFTIFWQFTNIEMSFLRTKYSRLKWYQHEKSDRRNYKLDIYKFETKYMSSSISLQGKYCPSPTRSGV
jgi:hypothetical protein